MKQRSDYSNTKVKIRNLLTNVSYRRFKQSDFDNSSFIVDILSFLVQNFNPINLDIKLGMEKEQDMIKFLRDKCFPQEFVSFIYKEKYYEEISQPNLTYQRTNNIVKEYLVEDPNRIDHLKFKIEEKFNLIHYIYLLLFSKIYNRTNNFGIKRKNNFDFNFQLWKKKKIQNNVKNFNSLLKVDSLAKNPSNCEKSLVKKHEQQPIDTSINDESPTKVYSHENECEMKTNCKEKTFRKKIRRKH